LPVTADKTQADCQKAGGVWDDATNKARRNPSDAHMAKVHIADEARRIAGTATIR
jgi:hypothetical protein